MSALFQITANTFECHRRNDESVNAERALDEIDQRHHEVAEMIVLARDLVLHGDDSDREKLSSHLYATLALLGMIASPFDAVHAEMQRLRKIVAGQAQATVAGKPARA